MIHKFAIQILPIKMLLRDVVWLGIASKLSLLSPYTTLPCYLVTSFFLQQHKRGGKNCKSAENQSHIILTSKQFVNKWHMMTMTMTIGVRPCSHPFHIPFHKLQSKHNGKQPYTPKCELWTVKCNDFWFFEKYIIWHYQHS